MSSSSRPKPGPIQVNASSLNMKRSASGSSAASISAALHSIGHELDRIDASLESTSHSGLSGLASEWRGSADEAVISGVLALYSEPPKWTPLFVALSSVAVLHIFASTAPNRRDAPIASLSVHSVTLAQILGKWVLQVEGIGLDHPEKVWRLKAGDPQSLQFWFNAINKVLHLKENPPTSPQGPKSPNDFVRLERTSSLRSHRKASTDSTDSSGIVPTSPPVMSRSRANLHYYNPALESIPSPASPSGPSNPSPPTLEYAERSSSFTDSQNRRKASLEYHFQVPLHGSETAAAEYRRKASTGSDLTVPPSVMGRQRTAFDAYRSISPGGLEFRNASMEGAARKASMDAGVLQQVFNIEMRRGRSGASNSSNGATAATRSVSNSSAGSSRLNGASGNGIGVSRQPSLSRWVE
ncbi:hypothetical protein BC830DRAFT_1094440 [Chytriomyces sp. MP71]|nr:hypothetical protein BC830DRAFT_1094440 [Chytriomyces sp. MP71]